MIDLETVDLATLEAVIGTDKGEMVMGFFAEKAPGHVRNFLDLAQKGFYDGLAFHRIMKGFMIQGGCPNTREGVSGIPGTGGPGYQIPAEFNDEQHVRGALSMARSANPDSAGSQFFVVHAEHAQALDEQYTVFGKLKDGFDVLDTIASTEVDFGNYGERSLPKDRIELLSVTVRVAEPEPEPEPEEESEPTESSASEAPAEDAEV